MAAWSTFLLSQAWFTSFHPSELRPAKAYLRWILSFLILFETGGDMAPPLRTFY